MRGPIVPILLLCGVSVQARVNIRVSPGVDVTIVGKEGVAGYTHGKKFPITQYLGIQYATKGDRFLLPKDIVYERDVVESKVIDATRTGIICPRVESGLMPEIVKTFISGALAYDAEGEDPLACLTMDIVVPRGRASKKMPVVVSLHGGSLTSGSRREGQYRIDNVHRHEDVSETIFVNVDMNLGPWGFWHFIDGKETHTNAALHEVLSALRWVHRYIGKFGGDPRQITLMGHSAGATMAQYVHFMLSGHRRELLGFPPTGPPPFAKLVLSSGSAFLFRPVSIREALERQEKVMRKSECGALLNKNKDEKKDESESESESESEEIDLMPCFQTLSDAKIAKASRAAGVTWSPIMEKKFLMGDPQFHLEQSLFGHDDDWKPAVLITVTEDDSSMFCVSVAEDIRKSGMLYWSDLIEGGDSSILARTYSCERFGNCPLKASICFTTDALFIHPAMTTQKYYEAQKLPVAIHQYSFVLTQLGAANVLVGGALDLVVGAINGLGMLMAPQHKKGDKLIPEDNFASDIAKKLSALGCFHGSDIWALNNGLVAKDLRVEAYSNPVQLYGVARPLYAFINDKRGLSRQTLSLLKQPRAIAEVARQFKVGMAVEHFQARIPITNQGTADQEVIVEDTRMIEVITNIKSGKAASEPSRKRKTNGEEQEEKERIDKKEGKKKKREKSERKRERSERKREKSERKREESERKREKSERKREESETAPKKRSTRERKSEGSKKKLKKSSKREQHGKKSKEPPKRPRKSEENETNLKEQSKRERKREENAASEARQDKGEKQGGEVKNQREDTEHLRQPVPRERESRDKMSTQPDHGLKGSPPVQRPQSRPSTIGDWLGQVHKEIGDYARRSTARSRQSSTSFGDLLSNLFSPEDKRKKK